MAQRGIQEHFVRAYGAVAINDPSISIQELGDKIIELVPENMSDESMISTIVMIIQAGNLDRGRALVDYLLAQKLEWGKALFAGQLTCLYGKGDFQQIIKIAKEYESKYGRDDNSTMALVNAYLAEGYAKHVEEIQALNAELKQKMGQ